MAGKREERKKARFQWLMTSWLVIAIVIVVGVGGIIFLMDQLYQKENHKAGSTIPQMLGNIDASSKWANVYSSESQASSEIEKVSSEQPESTSEIVSMEATSDANEETEFSTEKNLTEQTEENSSEESSSAEAEKTTANQAVEPNQNIVIGDVKSE